MSGTAERRREFGAYLAGLRRRSGRSQRQFAAALCAVSGAQSITWNEVSRWERGERIPDVWLPTFAQVLGVPLRELEQAAAYARRDAQAALPGVAATLADLLPNGDALEPLATPFGRRIGATTVDGLRDIPSESSEDTVFVNSVDELVKIHVGEREVILNRPEFGGNDTDLSSGFRQEVNDKQQHFGRVDGGLVHHRDEPTLILFREQREYLIRREISVGRIVKNAHRGHEAILVGCTDGHAYGLPYSLVREVGAEQ
nr:helix-turn-helix domain-containing protein [Actinomadura craniellae]